MVEVVTPQADVRRQERYKFLRENYPRALVTALFFMPELFPLKPAIWHKTTVQAYETRKNCAVAGWRGGAKSTVALGYAMDQLLHYDYKAMMHICRSGELVKEHSGHVRHHLENNARLIDRFHITPGVRQEQDWFEVKIGKAHKETVTFAWMTRDGSIRGLHPNLVLIDDLDDTEDSPYMMDKYYQDVHSTIMGAMDPFEGVPDQILVCGNYTGEHCSMIKYQTKDAVDNPDSWIVRAIPALEEGKTIQWTGAPIGESTWPERRTTEWLHKKRRDMNAGKPFAFEMEFQNRLVSANERIWSEEMFVKRFDLLPPPHQLVTRMYMDTAQKTQEAGDETAFAKYSKCIDGPDKGKYYRREMRMGHLAPDEIAKEALVMYIGNGTKSNPECECLKIESKTKKGEDPLAAYIKLYASQNSVNMIIDQLVPSTYGDKAQRSRSAVKVGRAGALYSPLVESPDLIRSKNQMISFTGKRIANMPAVDDGHDAEVWACIDLLEVESRQHVRAQMYVHVPIKNAPKAVG